MTSKEIAVQIVANVEEGGAKFEALKKAITDYINWAAQENKEVFTDMDNEQLFLDVCKELANLTLPSEKLKAETSKNAPFWLKPFIGVIVDTFKLPLIAFILNTIDKQVLDKRFGDNWYLKLREIATKGK
jgi:hypothetical protein